MSAKVIRLREDQMSDMRSHLEASEVILPEQFFVGPRGSVAAGERAMMLAVLEDGIRCFQEHLRNPREKPRLLSAQAEEWIKDVDYDWPFSFVNICEALGIDPSALRTALLAWKTKREAENTASTPAEPHEKLSGKIYRLHLRTKRMAYVR